METNQVIVDALKQQLKLLVPDLNLIKQLAIKVSVDDLLKIKNEAIKTGNEPTVITLMNISKFLKTEHAASYPDLNSQLDVSDAEYGEIVSINLKSETPRPSYAAKAAARCHNLEVRKKLLDQVLEKSNKLCNANSLWLSVHTDILRIYLDALK